MIKGMLMFAVILVPLTGVCIAWETNDKLEKNKAIARKVFEEILSKGKIAENENIYSPSFVAHGDNRDAGRAEDREAAKGWRQAAPDLVMTVDKIVAEGELVAVRWIGQGTNTGTGNGLPATGRRIKVSGITLFHIVDGKILEEWTSFNEVGMLKQLGLFPENTK
jgi:steroid delta-isomerase-like uncharacterized protein